MGDVLLHAESEAADGKRIDRTQYSLGVHRGAKAFRCHAMPHADFDETPASRCVLRQTITLGARGLRGRRCQAQCPGDVMREDFHGVSMAGMRWAKRLVRARMTVSYARSTGSAERSHV